MTSAYIVAAVRTAGGKRGGSLSGWHPVDLSAKILDELVNRTKIDPAAVDDVIMGCVGQAGEQSANIGRNAVLASSLLPESVPGTSVDRQCGSSQQALHFATQAIKSGTQDIVIAAGVESMSRVPIGFPMTFPRKHGFGFYMSEALLKKYKGIEFSQFLGAEMMAKKYGLTKADLDQFALKSQINATHAVRKGLFKEEILPVEAISFDPKTNVTTRPGKMHDTDEGVRFDSTFEAISSVKLLQEGGVISAANASQICDGASGVMVASEAAVKRFNLKPLARVHHISLAGGDPVIMLESPLPGTVQALKKAGMNINDIDLFEINEAFASVPLAWLKHTGADPARLNVNGGAIALGHPLGASGTKLMTTLVYALKNNKKRWGFQSMCEGGGMANMTIIENLQL